MIRKNNITANWKNIRQRRLFEDFFDDSDNQEIITDVNNDIDSTGSFNTTHSFDVVIKIAHMIELKHFNIAKVCKKMMIVFGNSKMFDNLRIDNITFTDEDEQKTFNINPNNPPTQEDYLYKNVKYAIYPHMYITFNIIFLPSRKITYKKFCDELYDIMKLSAENCIYHPESKGKFIFHDKDYPDSDIDFGFYQFPMEGDIRSLYMSFYGEDVNDERLDNENVHKSVDAKTNFLKIVNIGIQKIKDKYNTDCQLLSIENDDTNNIRLIKLKITGKRPSYIEVETIILQIKHSILDLFPLHYFMVNRVFVAVYTPDDWHIEHINNKILHMPMVDDTVRKLTKAAKIEGVTVTEKTDDITYPSGEKYVKSNRFVAIKYNASSSAVAYILLPNKSGKVAKKKAFSKNHHIQKILDKIL